MRREPDRGDRPVARRRHDLDIVAVVSLAGVLGSLARYGVSEMWPVRPGHLPWSTLGINLTGSALLGFLLVMLVERLVPTRYARAFVAVGFLGAFTTFSTFAVETVALVSDGAVGVAMAYVALSLVGGLTCAAIGVRLARGIPHRHPPAPTHPEELDNGT